MRTRFTTFRQYAEGSGQKKVHPDVEKFIRINFKNPIEKEAAYIFYDVMTKHKGFTEKSEAEFDRKTAHLDASRAGWVNYKLSEFMIYHPYWRDKWV